MAEVYRKLAELIAEGTPCATATIISKSGSIPNDVGATLVANAEGALLAGTVGGGEIEWRTLANCKEALAEGAHRHYTYHLTDEESGGIGMMCGGKAELFIQVHLAPAHLVLVGAGHINLELARLAGPLGYRSTVVDDRTDWANLTNYPHSRCINLEAEAAYAQIDWTGESYLVIGTRDRDFPALRAAIGLPCRYIGVVASKRKAITLLSKLRDEGIDLESLRGRIYAPIGLALGGRTPAQIALSIVAEIEQLRHRASGGHLTLDQAAFDKVLAKKSA
ncbi:MAG: XdhC family protein [Deltaproteobacteria bacterium]|nr:XdhC family protein [Deltaproteobacteria bacterium]